MFGNKPFGTATTFGQGTFGTTTPFGQSNTAFGGKPATGNVFGASTFGATAPNTGIGLFGAATPTTGTGLFGQPANTGFGQPASTSGGSFVFGPTSNTGPNLFGTTAPVTQQSTGLFGGNSSSAFGTPRPTFGGFGAANTGSSLFGQNTSTSTGLFGSTTGFCAAPVQHTGTTIKFNPPTGTDTMMKGGVSQNISTRHQCITCMKEYENKSLEELRLEDYLANRKGPQPGMTTGFGGGMAQPTNLFGAPAASTTAFSFGSTTQAKPLFGTTGSTTGTGLFGQPAQQQNTMFGKPVSFGAPTTSATTSFGFGNTTGSTLFGQNQQQKMFGQPTGLYGQPAATTQPSTGFGATTGFGSFGAASQPTTLFGVKPTGFGTTNPATTNSFTFGNPTATTTGLFGQKPAAPTLGTSTAFGTGFGFGNTAQPTGGLFGQTKPATLGFGTNPATSFGSTLGTGFGTNQFSSMGMNNQTGTNLFGSNLVNKGQGFNFGGTGTTGFGGFGQTNTTGSNFSFGNPTGFNASMDPNAANNLQQQIQAQQIFAFTANPYGDNPLFRNTFNDPKRREDVLKPTNPAAQKAMLTSNQLKVSALPSVKIKPKPITPIRNGKVSLFDGLEDEENTLSNLTFVPRKNVKQLTIKVQSSPGGYLNFTSSLPSSVSSPNQTEISFSTSINVERTTPGSVERNADRQRTIHSMIDRSIPDSTGSSVSLPSTPVIGDGRTYVRSPQQSLEPVASSNLNDTIEALHTRKDLAKTMPKRTEILAQDKDSSVSDTETSSSVEQSHSNEKDSEDRQNNNVSSQPHPTGIKLTSPGYSTVPTLEELEQHIDENGEIYVANFTVCREGYGKVMFPDTFNVANLNLDEIVQFRRKEITVYPDDMGKPPVGEGLNRYAVVTLDCVWPTDKTTHSPIKDEERLYKMGYRERIDRSTRKLGARFIDYIPETGCWVFEVDHFSKYGLEDSDDECEDPKLVLAKKTSLAQQKPAVQPNNTFVKEIAVPATQSAHNNAQAMKKLRVNASAEYVDDEMNNNEMRDAEDDLMMSANFYSPLEQFVAERIEPERIQGMKASFFLDDINDEWTDENSSQDIPQFNMSQSRDLYIRPVPIKKPTAVLPGHYDNLYTRSNFGDFLVQSSMQPNESCTFDVPMSLETSPVITIYSKPVQPEKLRMGPQAKITLKQFSESIGYGKNREISSGGYYMGNRFRAGWATDWKILHLQSMDSKSVEDAGSFEPVIFAGLSLHNKAPVVDPKPFAVHLSKVDVFSSGSISYKKNLIASMKMQLNHVSSTVEDGAPIFVPNMGHRALHSHEKESAYQLSEIAGATEEVKYLKTCNHIWALCIALWGDIPGLDSSQNQSAYEHQMARREALSNWLIVSTKDIVMREITDKRYDPSNYLNKIFSHLTSRQISEAVILAQEHNDHQLATLLAQLEGNSVTRTMIAKLLANWEESHAYKTIKYQRLKLYALLAGFLLWDTPDSKVNCCENLDWKRSFALHLWYYCSPVASISHAVAEFEKSFSDLESAFSSPPHPTYVEKESIEKSGPDVFDVCFHLLKLYCDRSQRLDKLLMPATSTADHLDCRLSWLLYQALAALGYEHLQDDAAFALNRDFAAQLEAVGLWEWAVFVLLHLPVAEMRKKLVKDLLLRHVGLEESQRNEVIEEFLRKELSIPTEWIYEAKAIKARSNGLSSDEAFFLLKAGLYSQSHEVVITKLASHDIINENYDHLMSYLEELAPVERSSTILDWASGGQVFMDYIYLSRSIESIVRGDVGVYDVERLQPEVLSLCQRLSSINCPTAKDRLCQAEMAKKTATLLQLVCSLQSKKELIQQGNFAPLATFITSLPLPEDYAVQELRSMARNYMLSIMQS